MAFLCDEAVVQLGEQVAEPACRPVTGEFRLGAVGCDLGFAAVTLLLRFAVPGPFAAGQFGGDYPAFDGDLDRGECRLEVLIEALGAQSIGSSGHDLPDLGWAETADLEAEYGVPMSHRPDDSEQAIFDAANRFVLEVGAALLERKARAPKGWDSWVVSSCPFSLATANRIVAVTRAQSLGVAAPEPWTALS